jgi:hypothetical protein
VCACSASPAGARWKRVIWSGPGVQVGGPQGRGLGVGGARGVDGNAQGVSGLAHVPGAGADVQAGVESAGGGDGEFVVDRLQSADDMREPGELERRGEMDGFIDQLGAACDLT